MAYLIKSADVYTNTELFIVDGKCIIKPISGNLGPLPALYSKDGEFNRQANRYIFYQKAVKQAKDINPLTQALKTYYTFLEDNNLEWDVFPTIKRMKPTYLFRSHLLKAIKNEDLAASTASIRMNYIVKYYKWLMYEGYLRVSDTKAAPFITEFVGKSRDDMLAHTSKEFSVETTDLRIKVPRDSNSKNIRPLKPLSLENFKTLVRYFPHITEELKLQIMIAVGTGLRIQEVATLTLEAIETATPFAESEHIYSVTVGPNNGVQTKFGIKRTIEMSSSLLKEIKKYMISDRRFKRVNKLQNLEPSKRKTSEALLDALNRSEKHEPLFVSSHGYPATSKVIESRWIELKKQIKKEHPKFDHRFHDLRSTYATYRLHDLLENNLPQSHTLNLLMMWMGHRNERTTWKYLNYLNQKETFKTKLGLLSQIMHDVIEKEEYE